MGAELFGEVCLLGAACDNHGLEAHRDRVPHPEVTEAAETAHRDQIAGPGGAAPQPVEDGHARAGHRTGVARRHRGGDTGQGVDRRDHLLGEPSVVRPSGDFQVPADDEVALAAGFAVAAAAAESADHDRVADLPAVLLTAFAQFLDVPGNLVPRCFGERHAR